MGAQLSEACAHNCCVGHVLRSAGTWDFDENLERMNLAAAAGPVTEAAEASEEPIAEPVSLVEPVVAYGARLLDAPERVGGTGAGTGRDVIRQARQGAAQAVADLDERRSEAPNMIVRRFGLRGHPCQRYPIGGV
jgi:hypothetical protein